MAASGLKMPDPIKLTPEKIAISPAEFYIKNVTDQRPDHSPVANIFFAKSGTEPVRKVIDLEGGAQEAVRNFMFHALTRNTALRAVNVSIRECTITETLSGENLVSGEVKMVLQFDLEKDWGADSLTKYSASVRYTRNVNNIGVVEPALRKLLINSLRYINTWMNDEAPRNVQLARGVKISFSDYLDHDTDTVYYHSSRPLIWDDFRAKVSENRYSAAVFPSYGYDLRRDLKNGFIHVELAMKVYVAKSASWVSPGRQNSYSLNHEQRHFDLVKLIAERFKKKLFAENLNPDNYMGIINFEYLEFYREMNRIQIKYDLETSHGANAHMQMVWNRSIDNDLAAILR